MIYVPDVSHIKLLDRAVILQPVSKRKPIFSDRRLKDVQPTIKDDLPASVGGDIACMASTGTVEDPSELDTSACTGISYGIQKPALLGHVTVIRSCHQMNADLVFWRLALDDHFDKFHHILDLVEVADIGVGHDDPGSTVGVGTKYLVVANTFAIFSEDMMTFSEHFFVLWGATGRGRNRSLIASRVGSVMNSVYLAWPMRVSDTVTR